MNYLDFVAVVGFGQQTELQRSRKTTPDRSLLSQSTYGEVPSVLAKCHNILKSIRSRTIVARGYQTLDTRQDQRQGNVNQSHVRQPIDRSSVDAPISIKSISNSFCNPDS